MAKLLQNFNKLTNTFYVNVTLRNFSSKNASSSPGSSKISRKTWNSNTVDRSLLKNCTKPYTVTAKRYKKDALVQMQSSPYMVMRAAPSEFEDILDMMWQCYYPDEPCVRSLGLGRERNAVFDGHVLDMMQQGLSVVARCKYNGNIVGGSINNSASPWDPDLTERCACTLADPDMRELYLFWAYVQRAPNLWKKYSTNKIFEIADVFVAQDERGRGLGCMLTEYSMRLGADSDFNTIRCDATNSYEQKVCEKLGMCLEYDIPYCSYVGANNEPVISPSPPHDRGIKVYVARPHNPPPSGK